MVDRNRKFGSRKVVHKASPVFLFWFIMKGSGDTVLH